MMAPLSKHLALHCLALVCTLAAAPALAVEITNIRVGVHADKSRVVFDLSGPTEFSIQSADKPPRVIVELPDTTTREDSMSPISLAHTALAAVNLFRGEAGAVEVTLALNSPASTESFLLKPSGGRGYRLVVDLYDPSSRERKATSPAILSGPTAAASGTVSGPSAGVVAATTPTPGQEAKSGAPASDPRQRNHSPVIEFSGTWQQEWAYQTQRAGNQKFEALVQPRMDVGFDSGARLVAIARLRFDAVGDLGPDAHHPNTYSQVNGPVYNTKYAELSLREFYYDTEWAGAYWRLGKQQVVWGQADGVKVLDVVNPQSLREFILDDFDDSRIPLWMVNAELPLETGNLQVLWVPDTSYHELAEAGTPYFLTSPKWVPTIPAGTDFRVARVDKPDNALGDSNFGVRYSAFLAGWDISLNYLYHYQDYPVLYQQQQQVGGVSVLEIDPQYKRNNLFGGTLSNAFDTVTLRAELAYNTDTYSITDTAAGRGIENSDELASVIGLDWQYSGDGLLSAQWFLSYLPGYSSDIVRDESENTFSLLYQQNFANDTWQLRALGLYSLEDEDSLIKLKLKYWLLGDLELWLGGDIFHGTQRGTFGQFDEQSRVLLGMEYGF